jgi:hypothetical protein
MNYENYGLFGLGGPTNIEYDLAVFDMLDIFVAEETVIALRLGSFWWSSSFSGRFY